MESRAAASAESVEDRASIAVCTLSGGESGDGGHRVTSLDGGGTLAAAFAEVLADVLGVGEVGSGDHFFDDLGADSMVLARFCARVRKREGLPSVAMKQVYQHPTIERLASALEGEASDEPASGGSGAVVPGADDLDAGDPPSSILAPVDPLRRSGARVPAAVTKVEYMLCGVLQFALFAVCSMGLVVVAERGFHWIADGRRVLDVYERAVLFGGLTFAAICVLPVVAKWVLVGRWKTQLIRIWSVAYVRFWVVKTMIRFNPMALLAGSPLYVLYLRALGADIGRGAVIFSTNVPVCTDLLTVGEGTVIRKDSSFTCYRAHGGVIQTGAVTLGRDALVGEATVLDIGTSLGDAAQLGHSSSLHAGQAVPAGERWHGSPAQRTDVDYRAVGPVRCGRLRRAVYAALQAAVILLVAVPVALGAVVVLLRELPDLVSIAGAEPLAITTWAFYAKAFVAAVVIGGGALVAGLAVTTCVPRTLNHFLEPARTYPLYGVHYALHRAISRMTNIPMFTHLFGDSSAIVHYLRGVGYDLSDVEQTGSNFGLDVRHETPFWTSVGSGTMVADGLSIVNADYSSTSFQVSPTAIGARNFLGNYVTYPSQGRTGDDCLLATKVMVPIDGDVRAGVGLLGSPCFEIPRSVRRDGRFDHLKTGDGLRRRLADKNRHNAVTMALFLASRCVYIFLLLVLILTALDVHHSFGAAVFAVSNVAGVALAVCYSALVERAATSFRPLLPWYCSIYEPYFWWHERYWKLSTQPRMLDGTPFKGLVWRMFGVRAGKRVYDDGCIVMEKTLVTIGDDCTLNARSVIQPHSQEDGTFKSDRIAIGADCTVGVGALVHYGVAMGDGAALAADSFLMKGEQVPPHARWGGNPARELPTEWRSS